jgi:hypothetical protein
MDPKAIDPAAIESALVLIEEQIAAIRAVLGNGEAEGAQEAPGAPGAMATPPKPAGAGSPDMKKFMGM